MESEAIELLLCMNVGPLVATNVPQLGLFSRPMHDVLLDTYFRPKTSFSILFHLQGACKLKNRQPSRQSRNLITRIPLTTTPLQKKHLHNIDILLFIFIFEIPFLTMSTNTFPPHPVFSSSNPNPPQNFFDSEEIQEYWRNQDVPQGNVVHSVNGKEEEEQQAAEKNEQVANEEDSAITQKKK